MKKIWNIILYLICLLFLTGCYPKGTLAQKDEYAPYRIAQVNIVLASDLNPFMKDQVEVLDCDEYGRKLYRLRGLSVTIGPTIEMLIISQIEENGYVYYYPDLCYLIREEDSVDFTEAQTERLKAQNDWGKPVNEAMLYSVPIDTNPPTVDYSWNGFGPCVRRELGIKQDYLVNEGPMELYQHGKQLFWANVFLKDPDTKEILEDRLYLILWDAYAYKEIIACQEIPIRTDNQAEIAAFRERICREYSLELQSVPVE